MSVTNNIMNCKASLHVSRSGSSKDYCKVVSCSFTHKPCNSRMQLLYKLLAMQPVRFSILCIIQPVETKKKFQCDLCSQSFTRKTNLNNHLETVHAREQQHPKWRFQCPCCEEAEPFRTLTELIAHCNHNHNIEFGMYS